MTNHASDIYDCIVMGAGIAGVTAARDLQKQGLRVLLLEGSDRVGGRMYSRRDFVRDRDDKPIPVEAGAEYIHVKGRRVFMPIEWERYQKFWDEIDGHGFCTSAFYKMGSLLPPGGPRNRVFFPVWKKTKPSIEAVLDEKVAKVGLLLYHLQAFNPTKREDMSAKQYVNDEQKYEGLAKSLGEYTLTAHTPGRLDTISIAGFSADKIPDQLLEDAERRLELPQEKGGSGKICGYDSLPNTILQEFRDKLGGTFKQSNKGQSNMKVIRVEWSGDRMIKVTTQGGETFVAHAAVCTFSVGMLDPVTGEGNVIFGPEKTLLTDEKRTALEIVKMGAITKFSLQFKERKWDEGGEEAGSWAGHMSVLSNPQGAARTFFSAFPDRQDGPHVLTALLMGTDHENIKNKNDAEAIQHLLDVLQAVYDPAGPQWTPEGVLVMKRDDAGKLQPNYLRQDWAQDEFAKGGNSFLRFVPKAERETKNIQMQVTQAREALKNPRETLPLFWAGEATAPAYDPGYQPLSVHGAYISGVGVAEDVHFYVKECQKDAERFGAYYKTKYIDRKEAKDPVLEQFDRYKETILHGE
jgi:monoamine oxidase